MSPMTPNHVAGSRVYLYGMFVGTLAGTGVTRCWFGAVTSGAIIMLLSAVLSGLVGTFFKGVDHE